MKKLILITGISVYVLFAVSMLIKSAEPKPSYERIVYETKAPEIVTETEKSDLYLLKSVDGKIAVEEISSGKIIKKTDTLVSILPEKDKDMLKKGIRVKSERELVTLLEDFCS